MYRRAASVLNKGAPIYITFAALRNVSSRTLEQVASLPVPLVPPCGGLRRAASNEGTVLWHAV